ncbi:hypothetical protein LCGC14_0850980 [marine sediment metagenome]|uniref:Uncharacterized protein n=1 Tax=marine sediment metagenome TaxID=412755 RepID=A0A0F9RV45_9ZZZZ
MEDTSVQEFERFIRKMGGQIADEIDRHVKLRSRKLAMSNKTLRSNLEAEKVKTAGAKKELDGQVARARQAEERTKLVEERAKLTVEERDSLRAELNALRDVLTKTEAEKRAAAISATKAKHAIEAMKAEEKE